MIQSCGFSFSPLFSWLCMMLFITQQILLCSSLRVQGKLSNDSLTCTLNDGFDTSVYINKNFDDHLNRIKGSCIGRGCSFQKRASKVTASSFSRDKGLIWAARAHISVQKPHPPPVQTFSLQRAANQKAVGLKWRGKYTIRIIMKS